MKATLEKLQTTAWKTAGSRYNAARRLRRRDFFSTLSLAFFSVATVAQALVQKIYAFPANSPADNYTTVLAVTLGVFLLAVSLLEAGRGNALQADALHRNAEELTSYSTRASVRLAIHNSGGPITSDEIKKLAEEYESIKAKCQFNHSPQDYDLFLAQKRNASELAINGKPPASWFIYVWRVFWSFTSSIWYFAVLWCVVVGLMLSTPWPAHS